MEFLHFREPANTWTHLAWMILAVPATALLCWKTRRDPLKQFSVLVYGLSLICCFAGSVLYHAVRREDLIETCAIVDYIGIYLLLGGSYTVLAFNLMEGRWRWGVLATVWVLVAAGVVMNVVFGDVAPGLYTMLYLVLGWGAIFCYFELARLLGHRRLFPLLAGGILYSVGALINRYWFPNSSAHLAMHFFIMLGSLVHFWFVLRVVVPYRRRSGVRYASPAADLTCAAPSELNP